MSRDSTEGSEAPRALRLLACLAWTALPISDVPDNSGLGLQLLHNATTLVSGWAAAHATVADLEQYQRAAVFAGALTADELHRLCLQLQHCCCEMLCCRPAGANDQRPQAMVEAGEAASRQLVALKPGAAVWRYQLGRDISWLRRAVPSVADVREAAEAYEAALAAAEATKGGLLMPCTCGWGLGLQGHISCPHTSASGASTCLLAGKGSTHKQQPAFTPYLTHMAELG